MLFVVMCVVFARCRVLFVVCSVLVMNCCVLSLDWLLDWFALNVNYVCGLLCCCEMCVVGCLM